MITRRHPDVIALDTMCPRCEARPGQPCVTVSGGRSSRFHSPRTGPLYEAWKSGYRDGLADARTDARGAAS